MRIPAVGEIGIDFVFGADGIAAVAFGAGVFLVGFGGHEGVGLEEQGDEDNGKETLRAGCEGLCGRSGL